MEDLSPQLPPPSSLLPPPSSPDSLDPALTWLSNQVERTQNILSQAQLFHFDNDQRGQVDQLMYTSALYLLFENVASVLKSFWALVRLHLPM